MQARWHEMQENAKQMLTDVSMVLDNFMGAEGYQWLHPVPEAGDVHSNLAERFVTEMHQGTQFYNQDSNIEDKISLSVSSAIFAIPYFVGRVLYDGMLDTAAYVAWRKTGSPQLESYPDRRLNGFILGAPVALPLVATFVGVEAVGRLAGISKRGGASIQLGHEIAVMIMRRYFESCLGTYSLEDLKKQINIMGNLFEKPSVWDLVNIPGLFTFPLLINILQISGAVVVTGALGVGEAALRFLGFTAYGAHIIKAAVKRTANMSKYTRLLFGGPYEFGDINDPESIAADQIPLGARPASLWNILDYAAFFTLPGMVAAMFISMGVGISLSAFGWEFLGCFLGISERGGATYAFYGKLCANIMARYTRIEPYNKKDFMNEADVMGARIDFKNPWDLLHFAGMTIPSLIGVAGVIVCSGLRVGIGALEFTGRVFGFSAFGLHMIKGTGKHAAGLSKYTRHIFGEYDQASIDEDIDALFKHPPLEPIWNFADHFAILPIIFSTLTYFGSFAITLVGGLGEFAARALGFSARGKAMLGLFGKLSAVVSARYFNKMTGEYSKYNRAALVDELKEAFKKPTSLWDFPSIIGLIPAAIAGAAVLAASAVATVVIGIGEFIGRCLGFSKRTFPILVLGAKLAAKVTNRYFDNCTDPYLKGPLKQEINNFIEGPFSFWDIPNYIGAMIIGVPLAFVTTVNAVIVSAVLHVGEFIGRCLGFSDYSGEIVAAAFYEAQRMSPYMRRLCNIAPELYNNENRELPPNPLLAKPKSIWDWADRIGFFTAPGMIAGVAMLGAIAISAVCYLADYSGRLLGFSERGLAMIKLGCKISSNIFNLYRGGNPFSPAAFRAEWREIFASVRHRKINAEGVVVEGSVNVKQLFNAVGAFTLPLVINAVLIPFASVGTLGACAIESVIRLCGISDRSKHGIALMGNIAGNAFGFTNNENLKAHRQKVFSKIKSWWDFCDVMGTAITMTATTAMSIIALPLSLFGFNKANYHRLNYYMHHVHNTMRRRRGDVVDDALENYHAEKLEQCKRNPVGLFASNVNVLNITWQVLYAVCRVVIVPVLYVAGKLLVNILPSLFGIIPLIRLFKPKTYSNDPVGKVRQRFAELENSIDKFGHLNLNVLKKRDDTLEVIDGEDAPRSSIAKRMGTGLFSQARQIISLGHTPDEKILSEFKKRFEEFVKASKRQPGGAVNPNLFFHQNNNLDNAERYDFDRIVEDLKRFYNNPDDRARIDRIAGEVRGDIEIAGQRPY